MSTKWFAGRTAALGTMHGKERVISPRLEAELGLRVVVPEIDTDLFGTFSGEIERVGSQIEAARAKALAAMNAADAEIGIASEGSFGPHPAMPFVPGNLELVVLVDRANGFEIAGRHVTAVVRHEHADMHSVAEARAFGERAGLPEHALIAKCDGHEDDPIVKGIVDLDMLETVVERLLRASLDGTVHLETDLRAHLNPTRMEAIAAATEELVAAAKLSCPVCDVPGFTVVDRRTGLPCAWCGQPTGQTAALIHGCARCEHREEAPRPDGKTEADPGQCAYCNP